MKKNNILTTIFVSFITTLLTGTITVFAVNGILSSQVEFNNNIGLKDGNGNSVQNVQGAIESLYAEANDYSNIESKFVGEPTSIFHKAASGDGLELGRYSSQGNTFIDFYHNNEIKSNMYYNASDGNFYINSRNGSLNLLGDSVKFNNTNLKDILAFQSVSGTIGLKYGSHISLTAPSKTGYVFKTWYHCQTTGWVGSMYVEYPLNATSNVWNATYGRTDETTGTVTCYALYIKNN